MQIRQKCILQILSKSGILITTQQRRFEDGFRFSKRLFCFPERRGLPERPAAVYPEVPSVEGWNRVGKDAFGPLGGVLFFSFFQRLPAGSASAPCGNGADLIAVGGAVAAGRSQQKAGIGEQAMPVFCFRQYRTIHG